MRVEWHLKNKLNGSCMVATLGEEYIQHDHEHKQKQWVA
jgi:hypothetical protein